LSYSDFTSFLTADSASVVVAAGPHAVAMTLSNVRADTPANCARGPNDQSASRE
jgi:hypothetical protein